MRDFDSSGGNFFELFDKSMVFNSRSNFLLCRSHFLLFINLTLLGIDIFLHVQ